MHVYTRTHTRLHTCGGVEGKILYRVDFFWVLQFAVPTLGSEGTRSRLVLVVPVEMFFLFVKQRGDTQRHPEVLSGSGLNRNGPSAGYSVPH